MPMCTRSTFSLIFSLIFFSSLWSQPDTARKQAQGRLGMVVSAHPLATQAGIEVLEQGGNAIDAAVAVQLALAVVYPGAGNLGGGGFLLYREAKGPVHCLDFREKAPLAAHKDLYLDKAGNVVPAPSRDGALAVGVPGTPAGIQEMLRRFGRLNDRKILYASAIRYARQGYPVSKLEAADLNENAETFQKVNKGPVPFLKPGTWRAGDTLRQEQLAITLERMCRNGEGECYSGKTARALLRQMKRSRGLIRAADLTGYRALWRSPLQRRVGTLDVWTLPPPSSGGIILLQGLEALHQLRADTLAWLEAPMMQRFAETEKWAFADRSLHLGDPDFWRVPVDSLLSPVYIRRRTDAFKQFEFQPSSALAPAEFRQPHEETTHLCVVDRWGNAVSLTTTLNGRYGSKLVVQGAGFLLNNEMDDFSLKPGTPNQFGLVGKEANAIQPGKRMLSSMAASIVLDQRDSSVLAIGSPGGATIPTSILQVLTHILWYGKSLQAANAAPRFHHQWLPDLLYVEQQRFSPALLSELEKKGYVVKERSPIGRVEIIRRNRDGLLEGSADPRGDDDVRGVAEGRR